MAWNALVVSFLPQSEKAGLKGLNNKSDLLLLRKQICAVK